MVLLPVHRPSFRTVDLPQGPQLLPKNITPFAGYNYLQFLEEFLGRLEQEAFKFVFTTECRHFMFHWVLKEPSSRNISGRHQVLQ